MTIVVVMTHQVVTNLVENQHVLICDYVTEICKYEETFSRNWTRRNVLINMRIETLFPFLHV